MSGGRKYKLGPDVEPDELLRDSKGNVIDNAFIERAVEDVQRPLGGSATPDELSDPLVGEPEKGSGVSDGEA